MNASSKVRSRAFSIPLIVFMGVLYEAYNRKGYYNLILKKN